MVNEASGEYCDAVSDQPSAAELTSSDEHPVGASSNQETRTSADLGAIEADLAAVEVALNRLESGTYWTDEVTGEPIPDQLLVENPLLRRVAR